MNTQQLTIISRVIARSGREHPADDSLRELLKMERGLPRTASREISRTVFTYYRWKGMVDATKPIADQVEQALELARQFAENPGSFTDEVLMRTCVPEWIREQMEVSPAWVRSLQGTSKLWLRAKVGHGTELARKLGNCFIPEIPALADAIDYQGDEDLFRTEEFQAGEFEVQDINSQRVGLICDPKPSQTWWDACAGGGGKTLHLSDLMRNKGLIWASDRAEWRLKRLKLRAARAKCFNYRSVWWDGNPKLPTNTMFDGVLVDAPCSGIGTWQRNPHSRWTTTPQDVAELSVAQCNLLNWIAPSVKPGGKLVYAVCTLTRAETVEVARAFTVAFPDFEPVVLPIATLGIPAGADAEPTSVTLWPQDIGANGMFIAAWRKKAVETGV
jgi:16S rRNA (cytosine967-C5)-methyltransferase